MTFLRRRDNDNATTSWSFRDKKKYEKFQASVHRIIDDRIEKSIKGSRIGHCVFAASIFKVQRCLAGRGEWGGRRVPQDGTFFVLHCGNPTLRKR